MATAGVDLYLFYFFIWFVSYLLLWSFITTFRKSKPTTMQRPPAPLALPIIGHLHLLSSNFPKSLHTLSSKYGPFMSIRIGWASTMFVVSNAAIAKQVLKTHDQNFASRPDFGGQDYYLYGGSSFFMAEYGTYWRFLKKICMSELVSAAQLSRLIEIRREEMVKLLEMMERCSEEEKECDVGVGLMAMTNNIICRMGMSTRCSGEEEESGEIRELVKEIEGVAAKLSMGDVLGPLKKLDLFGYGRKLRDVFHRFDVLLERIMVEHEIEKERNGSSQRKDMMDILLEIYENQFAEVRLTRNNIKAFLMDIFLGGTNTTSVALQWMLAELINHPHTFKKLREEINTVVGPNRLVQESDVPNLPYLQAVVKESLRLHPSVPLIPRKCREDCKVNGYNILTDDKVFINVYAIMRDPDLWKDPTEFVPERFLVGSSVDGDQCAVRGSQSFHFLPFGGGRRACPGAALAVTVMHVTTAALVQCFNWKIKGGGKVDMEEGSGFSQGMAHPLLCYPISHFNPIKDTTTSPYEI